MDETLNLLERTDEPSIAWSMEVCASQGFESTKQLDQAIAQRIEVLPEDMPATEGPVIGFMHEADQYDTRAEYRDYDNQIYAVDLPIDKFLKYDPYDERRDGSHAREELRQDIIDKAVSIYGDKDSWWHGIDSLGEQLGNLAQLQPTEQFIIGRDGRGVRFYNYGAEMTEKQQQDCTQFIELYTQFFGDHTFNFMTDVVIAPFDHSRDTADRHTQGFVRRNLPKVMFIDSALLADDQPTNSRRGGDASRFLTVMAHEGGHLLDNDNDPDTAKLLEYAQSAGWDVDAMLTEHPQWQMGYSDLRPYAPATSYTVKMPDGKKQVSEQDFAANSDYAYIFDENGEYIADREYTIQGAPTEYSTERPEEYSADTTASMILGQFVAQNMPETRDAWLEYAQRKILKPAETANDRPLGAVPVNQSPIVTDRRTGEAILYPVTPLPKRIYVRTMEHF